MARCFTHFVFSGPPAFNPCEPNPCKANTVCVRIDLSLYACECLPNYSFSGAYPQESGCSEYMRSAPCTLVQGTKGRFRVAQAKRLPGSQQLVRVINSCRSQSTAPKCKQSLHFWLLQVFRGVWRHLEAFVPVYTSACHAAPFHSLDREIQYSALTRKNIIPPPPRV